MFKHPLRRHLAAWSCALSCALVSGGAAHALSVDEARHLLTRSGFGAAPHEIERLLPLSREAAVDTLLDGMDTTDLVPPPAFLAQPLSDYLQRVGDFAPREMLAPGAVLRPMTSEVEDRLTYRGMQEMEQLRVWWYDQMISTRSPMAERVALFWHNHFTTRYQDVLTPRLVYDQLQLERQAGTRNFAALLRAMMRDPAMLMFLDNALNTRKAPNENFARELLELFTLGIGHYTEHDIKELARMLAGHSVDFGGTWAYKLRPDQLDKGTKTFLGQTGNFNDEDAARILLAQPRTAQFLSEKFYREFVSAQLDAAEVDRLAAVLRGQQYEMRPFLRALLLSDGFWAAPNRGQLVKSPVELMVGFARTFGVVLPDGEQLSSYGLTMGQELFDPPSVEGWKGGMNWLTAQSVDLRGTLIQRLWAARDAGAAYQAAGPRDLIVRYAAETAGSETARLAVRVNGREVWRGQPQGAADTAMEGRFGLKPAWQVLRVPRDRLPAQVRSVEVVFDKTHQQPHYNLFVNWVQVDGRRLPTLLAHVTFPPGESCAGKGNNIPIGMLYCSGRLRYDLTRREAALAPDAATLYDRARSPVNSHIEYATTRVALANRPAARAAAVASLADEWQPLTQAEPARLQAAVSAVLPMQTRTDAGAASLEAQLRALTLDPAYNLK